MVSDKADTAILLWPVARNIKLPALSRAIKNHPPHTHKMPTAPHRETLDDQVETQRRDTSWQADGEHTLEIWPLPRKLGDFIRTREREVSGWARVALLQNTGEKRIFENESQTAS